MTMRDFFRVHAADVAGLNLQQAFDLRKALASPLTPRMLATDAGRGSGTEATPEAVAVFLLAAFSGAVYAKARVTALALFDTGLADSDGDGPMAAIEPVAPSRCAITGQWTFGAALVRLLSEPGLADSIDRVEIQHGARAGTIVARDGRVSEFFEGAILASRRGVWTVTICSGGALASAALTLAEGAV